MDPAARRGGGAGAPSSALREAALAEAAESAGERDVQTGAARVRLESDEAERAVSERVSSVARVLLAERRFARVSSGAGEFFVARRVRVRGRGDPVQCGERELSASGGIGSPRLRFRVVL